MNMTQSLNNQTYYAYARDISIIESDIWFVIDVSRTYSSETVSDIDLTFVKKNYWSFGSGYWGRIVILVVQEDTFMEKNNIELL